MANHAEAPTAEEEAKRVALAGYILDCTHQDEWPVAELRRVWDVAWAAATAAAAYREQERRDAAEAAVPRRCPWCDCEGQVSRTWDRAEPCWCCGSCRAVWAEMEAS